MVCSMGKESGSYICEPVLCIDRQNRKCQQVKFELINLDCTGESSMKDWKCLGIGDSRDCDSEDVKCHDDN